jgi:hypothetical protein
MGIKMTHPPSLQDILRRERMQALKLTHYEEPLLFVWCTSDLVDKRLVGEWTKQTILDILNEALVHPDVPKDFHAVLRPWAEGRRPDLERKKEWARSWKDAEVGNVHGYETRISEGLDNKGKPAKRYFFGGKRVDEKTYQTLVCEQKECPRHQKLMQSFNESLHGVKPVKRKEVPLLISSLVEEKEMVWQGQKVLARRAKLNKVFTCPAHGPIKSQIVGYDLYSELGLFIQTISEG